MIKVGIIGLGHIGKFHVEKLLRMPNVLVIGFFEPNNETAQTAIEKYGIERFSVVESLIEQCDALDITAPTTNHFELCLLAIKHKKHFFVEKPVTHTVAEAEKLVALCEGTDLIAQVGHIERFNPAYVAVKSLIKSPVFLIECQRLAPFNGRGTDVSVVLDLMIHDIDLILNLVDSEVTEITGFGSNVITDHEDTAQAEIKFASGCSVLLTTSRISSEKVREIKIFDNNAFYTVDLLNKSVSLNVTDSHKVIEDNNDHKTFDEQETLDMLSNNPVLNDKSYCALYEELSSFISSIENATAPVVSLKDGLNALKIATAITQNCSDTKVLNRK